MEREQSIEVEEQQAFQSMEEQNFSGEYNVIIEQEKFRDWTQLQSIEFQCAGSVLPNDPYEGEEESYVDLFADGVTCNGLAVLLKIPLLKYLATQTQSLPLARFFARRNVVLGVLLASRNCSVQASVVLDFS